MSTLERRARAQISRYARLRRFEVWPVLTEYEPTPYPVPEPSLVAINPQEGGDGWITLPCTNGGRHNWVLDPRDWGRRYDECSRCGWQRGYLRQWCGSLCKWEAANLGGCDFCAELEARLNDDYPERHAAWELGKAIWADNEEKERRRYETTVARLERERQLDAIRRGRATLADLRALLGGRQLPSEKRDMEERQALADLFRRNPPPEWTAETQAWLERKLGLVGQP